MGARSSTAARRCEVALCITLMAAGCATSDGTSGAQSTLKSITPSFLLSEHDRAQRNLKDAKSLNLAYGHFQETIGQAAEAHKSYELALREDPRSIDAILGLARLDQLADKPRDAEAGFRKALRLRPGDPAVMAACGQFYASQKRWPEAFEALNAAIAAAPKEPLYKHELGVAKTRSGDIDGGFALFSSLIGAEKAHYNVAFLLKQEGKSEPAAQQCRLALSINPNFEAARTMLAQIEGRQIAGDPRAPNPVAAAAASSQGLLPPSSDFGPSGSAANAGAPGPGPPPTSQTSWRSASQGTMAALPAVPTEASFNPAMPQNPPQAPRRPPSTTGVDAWPADMNEPPPGS